MPFSFQATRAADEAGRMIVLLFPHCMTNTTCSTGIVSSDKAIDRSLCTCTGRGGFGTVYFGLLMGSPVAVKKIDAADTAMIDPRILKKVRCLFATKC